jgi:GTP-binding protein YchF
MKVALVGLPQSGKSTVFSAVTGIKVDPYAAPEPRQAVVRVPDERLAYLASLFNPKKVTEATVEFIDVPGASLDDPKGQDEWRRLMPVVRQADLLVVVVRDFTNDSVPAYKNRVDARADFDVVWQELIFADLDAVTTRVDRIEKALKKPSRSHDQEQHELALLTRCREALESEKPLLDVITGESERRVVSSFAFLTQKPLVGVRNVGDDRANDTGTFPLPHFAEVITLSASIEAEIAALDPADRQTFLDELGIRSSARDRLIRTCYHAGGMVSFLTMGEDECRAWTVPKGATAVEAAARIHTDLSRNFIRAETVAYNDLVAHKDMKGARAAGKVRKEGKAYVVADGDIMNILANA